MLFFLEWRCEGKNSPTNLALVIIRPRQASGSLQLCTRSARILVMKQMLVVPMKQMSLRIPICIRAGGSRVLEPGPRWFGTLAPTIS